MAKGTPKPDTVSNVVKTIADALGTHLRRDELEAVEVYVKRANRARVIGNDDDYRNQGDSIRSIFTTAQHRGE